MASTMASSVSVLMVKPIANISVNVAISEIGMVTIGMIEARIERRKKKMTSTTSSDRFADGVVDGLDRAVDEHRAVVADGRRHALAAATG